MEKIWNNCNKKINEQVVSIIVLICSIGVIVLATLSWCDIWEDADLVYRPLMVLILLVQAIQNRNKDKPVAIISLLAMVIIIACIIIEIAL